ncbi:ribonuclease III [Advenella kashmirensis]
MNLSRLERLLGYQFKDQRLLVQALTHRSHSATHNERFEFLGDSILNFTVAAILFHRLQREDEGDLSRIRASLVKQATLADIAHRLELPQFLRLGEGELKSGGFRRPSILADALEAIFAAVYLDSDVPSVQAVIEGLYTPLLDSVDFNTLGKDAKTLLQEVLQGRKFALPIYNVVATTGAAHDQQFEVECFITELDMRSQASGSSRRAAEQAAARKMLDALEKVLPKGNAKKRVRKVSQLTLPVAVEQEKK